MKYDMKEIMIRAWEIRKEDNKNIFALCLKIAWAEAKSTARVKITREYLINRLEAKKAYAANRYNYIYFAYANDWQNYGKDRTYFVIYEKSNTTKHNAKIDYGYFDNINKEYIPGRHDLTDEFDVAGRTID